MVSNIIFQTLFLIVLTSSCIVASLGLADDGDQAGDSVDYTSPAVYGEYEPASGPPSRSTLPGAQLPLLASNDPYSTRPVDVDYAGSSPAIATVLSAPAAAKAAGLWMAPFEGLHSSGRFGKREAQYLNDLSRRLRDMYVEYKKRQNAFQFGLGKRSGTRDMSAFSFGLGKRADAGGAEAADKDYMESFVERSEQDGGMGLPGDQDDGAFTPKRSLVKQQRFAFGLGKRTNGGNSFAFGLGKRPMSSGKQQFSFGLGKRAASAPFGFGLGKRARQSAFQFGLGKRGSQERFAFGLGKRSYLSLEDDINDSVPVGDYSPSPDVNADDAGGLVHEIPRYFGHDHQESHLRQPLMKLAAFRFGLGKRSVDQKQEQQERHREEQQGEVNMETAASKAGKSHKVDSAPHDKSKPEIVQF